VSVEMIRPGSSGHGKDPLDPLERTYIESLHSAVQCSAVQCNAVQCSAQRSDDRLTAAVEWRQ
jgi:hypothetical protein